MARKDKVRRRIPAARVAAFIDHYIKSNYPLDPKLDKEGLRQFAFEAGMSERAVYRIRSGENVNVTFELLDDILVRLDREYLWHWGPERGGFSDYYQDEPGPEAEPSPEQERMRTVANAKRYARLHKCDWRVVLRERAEREMAEAA